MTARKRKLLVVDDDPGIRASLSVLLQAWGFEVLLASGATEATRVVERQDPDIVITDVVMPEIFGLELLRILKAGNPHRPVLLITAQGSIDMAVKAMKQGAREFLTKPLTDLPKIKALLDDAERELDLRRRSRRLAARAKMDGGARGLSTAVAGRRRLLATLQPGESTKQGRRNGGFFSRSLDRHGPS